MTITHPQIVAGRCRHAGPVLGLAMVVLVAAVAHAAEPSAPPQPRVAIPPAEVGLRAEAVARRLREIELRLRPSAALAGLPASLAAFHERAQAQVAETAHLLQSAGVLRVFALESERWHALREQTDVWATVIEGRTTDLEQAGNAVDTLHDTWTATRATASAADAPATITERIDGTLAEVRAAHERIAAAQGELLVLEDRVAQERAVCDEALARIDMARAGFASRLLVANRLPIWQALGRPGAWAEDRTLLADVVGQRLSALRGHVQRHGGRVVGQLLGFVLLVLVFHRMRGHARQWLAQDAHLAGAMRILERPYACAFFAVGLFSLLAYQLDPQALQTFWPLVVLASVVRLLPPLLPPVIGPAIVAVVGVSLSFRALSGLTVAPLFEQVALILAALLGMGICAWFSLLGHQQATTRQSATHPLASGAQARKVAGVLGTVAAAVLLAAALGYVPLARLVAVLLFGSFNLAALLFVLVRIIDAVVAYVLRVWPLRFLETVERHRPAIELRLHRTVVALAAIILAARVLDEVAFREPLWDLVTAIVGARASGGAFSISLGDVLAVIVTVWFAFGLSAFLRLLLSEDVFPRVEMRRGASTALPSLIHYLILTAAFFVCLALLGVDLTRVTILAGAFGVGIGFGLQDVVNNFAAGAILLLERPIQVGDTVQMGDLVATVHRIGMRSSTLRTGEGAEVIVPNGKLVASELTNWTLSDRTRRIEVPVAVAYDSDPERVLEVLRDVLAIHPGVLRKPAPEALLVGFGAQGLSFTLSAWVGVFEQWRGVRSELALAVHKALARDGIKVTG